MDIEKMIAYNAQQAALFEWHPNDFGASNFDTGLIRAIRHFQADHDLEIDGLCGPNTYRRLMLTREEEEDTEDIQIDDSKKSYIIFQERLSKIFWDKVTLWDDKGGHPAAYKSFKETPWRTPKFFVTHWDVCRKSSDTAKVLAKRKLSVHFLIDADSRIFQCMDLAHTGRHAGGYNKNSVGVEICNPYYLKYREYDLRRNLPMRGIVSGCRVHGSTMKDFLDFHPGQIRALVALYEAISWATDIPLNAPKIGDAVDPDCAANKHRGICNHHNLTRRKIDCANLDLHYVVKEAKKLRRQREV